MKNELIASRVLFDKESHTYTLDGKKLSGVTAIVRWLFPDTYKDIPQSVLEKAADYGSLVHSKCELYDNLGVGMGDDVVDTYAGLKEKHGLVTVANEYLIDDGSNIASSIDVVYEGGNDGEYVLTDIKTTSKIHRDNVRLQLSVYAWMFEQRNPGTVVRGINVMWIPKAQYGEACVMDLERLSDEACYEIVQGFINRDSLSDEDVTALRQKYFGAETSLSPIEEALPERLKETEDKIIALEVAISKLENQRNEIKKGLYEMMVANNVKKWQSDRLQLVRKMDSSRESVDTAKIKKDYPEVYMACKKVSTVKGSLTIKVIEK